MNWERYRPELAAQISDALGANVKLGGKLSITFFPYPKLSAEDAELSASGLHIRAPRLRLAAKLWPLLRGRVILSSAAIENPKIDITPNLWQLPRASQGPVSGTKVQLEDVEIENGALDIAFGKNHEVITEIDMQLRAPDWHGPYQADADFMWRGQEWNFNWQLGIRTPAGTRPSDFALLQADGPHQFSWHGAVNPVPFIMRGDGEWRSVADNLDLKAQINLADQVIEVAQGSLTANNKIVGAASGHFIIGANIWRDFNANLTNVAPGWFSGLPLIGLDEIWHKFHMNGDLNFHLQNGALANLKFTAPEMIAVFGRSHWHLWGQDAADALAFWGRPNIQAWPKLLTQAFDVRLTETSGGEQTNSLRLGKTTLHGSMINGQLELQTENMGWLNPDEIDGWRELFRDTNLEKFTLHARQWELEPFTAGVGQLTMTFGKVTDYLALTVPALTINGQFQNDNFKGHLDCQENHVLQLFHASCSAAQITGDENKWQFKSLVNADNVAQIKWNGAIDFADGAWELHMPFSHGEVAATGKLGQADYHMNVDKLDLAEFLQMFVPNAPKGDGDLSGQLHVSADKVEGDLTASNLQLSGLNLSLDNAAQPGKIATLTSKINWQGDVLELPQLHTTGPDGSGRASLNLDSSVWHGDWAEAHGNGRVAIDGDADSTSAQHYRFTETLHSQLQPPGP